MSPVKALRDNLPEQVSECLNRALGHHSLAFSADRGSRRWDLRRSFFALTSLLALGGAAPALAQTAAAQAPAAQAPAVPQAPDSAAPRSVGKAEPLLLCRQRRGGQGGAAPRVDLLQAGVTPRPARDGVHNVIDNLGEPVVIINHALQLKPKRTVAMIGRFALNSTVGIGGLFDVSQPRRPARAKHRLWQNSRTLWRGRRAPTCS